MARACTRPGRTTASSRTDRKSTRLNSSHITSSYAVFCLKKKTLTQQPPHDYRETKADPNHRPILPQIARHPRPVLTQGSAPYLRVLPVAPRARDRTIASF